MADFTSALDVPNGEALTTANSGGFTNVPPYTLTAVGSTVIKREGTASLHASGTGNLYLETAFAAAATTRHFGVWVYPVANPSTDTPVLYAISGAPTAFCWDVRHRTTGALQLRDSALAQIALTTTVLPLNQWSYFSVGAVNGVATLRLWAGDAASTAGGTPTETVSGAYATTSMTGAVLGSTSTATVDFYLDTYKERDAGPILLAAASVPLTGDAATQADTATVKVTEPTNGTAPYTHAIAQLSGPATTARAVGATGRWWAVERQADATTWRVTSTDSAGSTALVRDITVEPPGTGAAGTTAYFGTATGWVEV